MAGLPTGSICGSSPTSMLPTHRYLSALRCCCWERCEDRMDRTRHQVPPELAGERADKIVAVVAGVSRGTARQLIDSGLRDLGGARGRATSAIGCRR